MRFLTPELPGPRGGWIFGGLVKRPGSGVAEGVIRR